MVNTTDQPEGTFDRWIPWCAGWLCVALISFGALLHFNFIEGDLNAPGRRRESKVTRDQRIAVNEKSVNLHRIVEQGSLEQLQVALASGVDVNAPGRLQQTPLMVAIAARDLEKIQLLINYGADPELTDEFNATALRHAVDGDFVDGVRLLLSLGVDRGYHPKYPLKKVNYHFDPGQLKIPPDLRELLSEEEWKESLEETQNALVELGQNPMVQPVISAVQSVNVLRLFLETGDELNQAPSEVNRAYMGLSEGGEFRSSLEDFRKHKSPRYGGRNPERMDNPFWGDMIRLGGNAYSAREHFQAPGPFRESGAVWCFQRFGASLTPLEDGRFVQIAGEHEDHYDPDFFIYNDVVVHDGKGGFQIYGYPREVFSPTDFHTATLVGDSIYVIGCLGYPDQREIGRTPVYRLELESWTIEVVKTSGEMPSWLSGHRSKYVAQENVIRLEGGQLQVAGGDRHLETVPNEARFELDLSSFQWRKLD